MDPSIAQLRKRHNKSSFNSTNEQLNYYLHRQVSQDVKRKISICFVLVDNLDTVLGYYTLSNTSVPLVDLPPQLVKKLPPSYTQIPATLLGRLAVDQSISGQGWGAHLLIDALRKSLEVSLAQIGSLAVIVDPIDNLATSFYEKYGFIHLPDSAKMFLPMETIAKLI